MPNRTGKNWIALFSGNFLGVFNDNLLKNSIIFVSVSWTLPAWLTQSQLISIVSASLVFPYLIFSPYAGNLSVQISKLKIFRFFKLAEIPIMLLASVAFITENVYMAVVAVLLMGIQSCLYSPAKYGLIRDVGGEKKAAFGSGVFETMAFMGILAGTIVASVLSDYFDKNSFIALFLITAIAGYFVVRSIKVTELPTENPVQSVFPHVFLIQSFRMASKLKGVNVAVAGASIFWLIGGMLQMNLVLHTQKVYMASNTFTGVIMSVAAVAIALGCVVAARIAGSGTGKKWILPGITGMSVFLALLTFMPMGIFSYAFCIFGVAFSGGFLQVPSLAIIQQSESGRKLGDLIAYLNLTTFVFVLIGTILFWLITSVTNENSYAVFGALLVICLLAYLFFKNKLSTK